MKKSAPSDKQQFYRELAEYRATLEQHIDVLAENSILSRQLIFLMESAKFYIAQLDVWEKSGDIQRYEEAIQGARKNLDQLRELIIQMFGQDHKEADDDE